MITSNITNIWTSFWIPSLHPQSLTARHWKWMVGRRFFPFGARGCKTFTIASSPSSTWDMSLSYHSLLPRQKPFVDGIPKKRKTDYLDCPPSQDACGKWKFGMGSPTKNAIILVVTVTGRGDNPTDYTPGSTNIAGWKTGAPDWVDVFPIEHSDFPASYVSLPKGTKHRLFRIETNHHQKKSKLELRSLKLQKYCMSIQY